ncbi:MAG: DUF1361 domain-containing protein [Chlorobi bacterium]|nr:DUF1361 domain-containing protein [Chlorobiota bacterium]
MKSYKPILQIAIFISVLLLTVRIIYTGSISYLFLLWNLFLAYLPCLFSNMLLKTNTWNNSFPVKIMLIVLWLVFLPNAPYIVTDLFHLTNYSEVPLWFDLIMILFFAIAGLIFWLISIFQVFKYLFRQSGRNIHAVYFLLIIVLSSLGVYIGRYLRWNTWDLVINSPELFHDVLSRLIHPTENPEIYGMTIIFSLFLGFVYYVFQSFYLPKDE